MALHPCIHAPLSSPSHSCPCHTLPQLWGVGPEQHSRVGTDGGDRVSPQGLPQGPDGKQVTRKTSGVTSRPEDGRLCVCLLDLRDHLREPRASHKWKMSGEATKGRGASLGLKTPREVQGTRHSRPQRCTAFIWDIHSCWVRGSPGAMAQFATRSLVVRTLWRSERHKSVPLNGRPRAAAWVHLTYPGD